jgi:hypothetical protein
MQRVLQIVKGLQQTPSTLVAFLLGETDLVFLKITKCLTMSITAEHHRGSPGGEGGLMDPASRADQTQLI